MLGRALIICLAIMVSLVPLWPVYGTAAAALAIIAGTALGTAIAWLSFRRGYSLLAMTLIACAVFFAVGVPLAVPSKTIMGILPTWDGLVSLAAAVVLSWKQLVTVTTPVASYEALLVPALILSLGAGVVGVSWALRPKTRALAAVVPVVTLGLAIWLGPLRSFEAMLVASAVFILVVIWLALGAKRGVRPLVRALGVVAIPLIIAIGVAAVVTEPQRLVWRGVVEQPFVLQTDTSPLAEFRSYVTGEGASRIVLTETGLAAGDRISLATLDRYNGVVFSVGGTAADFTRVPGALAPEISSGRPLSSSITIGEVSGPWVPLPGELGSLWFEGRNAAALTSSFFYSTPAATGVLLGQLTSGDTYRTTGFQFPFLALAALPELAPGIVAQASPEVIPDGVAPFISRNADPTASAGQQLADVLTALQNQGYVSDGSVGQAPSRSGHGAERLAQLFTQSPMVGDAEQYAAAAAILANQLGFPARVVMGLVVPGAAANDSASPSASPSVSVDLTGSNMRAWIQVATTTGWVSIDPNPVIRPIPDRLPDAPTKVTRPQSGVVPPPVDVPRVQDQTPPEAATGELTPRADPLEALLVGIGTSAAITLLIAGLAVSPLLFVLALKARRRARRSGAEEARQRIEGAWDEFADIARDHGIIVASSLTRRETAKRVPQERSVALAKLVDRAQFAPGEPTHAQAEEAWRSVDQVRSGLEAPLTRRQRLRARLSTRSLADTRWVRAFTALQRRIRPRR